MQKQNITQMLEQIANEICDTLCKYNDNRFTDIYPQKLVDDDLMKVCENCPLNKLY